MRQFLTTLLLLSSLFANAQTWQWGKRGGGSSNGSNPTPYESVIDMATDSRGNVYALVRVESQGLPNYSTGSTTMANYNARGNRDIGVISYRCDGSFRWARIIGGAAPDIPIALGVDTVDGVYVAGRSYSPGSPNNQVSFEGGGPTWPYGHVRTDFIARYDTSGTFSWLRQPMSDTASAANYALVLDMTVAGGEAYCLAYLRPGLVGGTTSTVVTTAGVYLLRYGSTGTLLSLTPMQMGIDPQATQFSSFRVARSLSGRFVVAGDYPIGGGGTGFTLGSQAVTRSMFIGSFLPGGTLSWARYGSDSFAGAYSRPAIDAQGSIYVAAQGAVYGQFNGTPIVNTLGPHQAPFAVKLDSNGNNQWLVSASANSGSRGTAGVLRGGEFVMTGGYSGRLQFPGVSTSLGQMPNAGLDPYLVRIGAQTGAVVALDSLEGNGTIDGGTALAADRSGNVYVGGMFSGNLQVSGTTYQSNGGATDYFIAKWGNAACNCTAPTAAYTKTQNNAARSVSVTYSGTTTGLDSLVWTWGDGTKTKVTSNYTAAQTHTYAANAGSSFNVCATAYSSCGQNQTCQTVGFTISVEGLAALRNVSVYPNPATDVLFIDGAQAGTTYRLLSALGQEARRGVITGGIQRVLLGGLPAGPYLLILTTTDGARATAHMVRQ